MNADIRSQVAKYYDLGPHSNKDIPFYIQRIPSPDPRVLELGCGTGRVTLPLSKHCGFMQGVDASEAMLSICQEKLKQAGIPASKAQVEIGDITQLDLGGRFDWIIAPFRVVQNLETDEQIDGLFASVRRHMAPEGTCILNVFKPNKERERLIDSWAFPDETLSWEVEIEGGKLTCHDRKARIDPEKLVLYPELIYRKYEDDVLQDEAILKIAMRCYYPGEFEALVRSHGFRILNQWGGYAGETYGQGPELILEFAEGC